MKKKLLSVVLSLAVAFTFSFAAVGVASATPATDWSFNDDYSKVTAKAGTKSYTVNTVRTFNETNGMIMAIADSDEVAEITTIDSDLFADAVAYYYDVNGAVLYSGTTYKSWNWSRTSGYTCEMDGEGTPIRTVYSKAGFEGIFADENKAIELVEPAYCDGYNKNAPKEVALPIAKTVKYQPPRDREHTYSVQGGFVNWTAEFKMPKDYDKDSYAEQSFNVPVKFTPNGVVDGTEAAPELLGTVSKALTVEKSEKPYGFYLDGDEKEAIEATNTYVYDGAAHKVTFDAGDTGATVEYAIYNAQTGKYDAVDEVAFQNVTDENIAVKATVTVDKTATTKYFTIDVNAAAAPKVGFVLNDKTEKYEYNVEAAYDAWNYIELVPALAKDDAFAANEAEFDAFVKDFYEITETPLKFDANTVNAVFAGKDLEDAEKEALVDKYETLMANFGIDSKNPGLTLTKSAAAKATFLVAKPVDPEIITEADEVEFTKAPSAKTYHVKKAKALKATKTFTVKAVATSEKAVTYKLINANSKIKIDKATGTVTVKKGLKKGTYKIKVKAYTTKTPEFFAAAETQAITIKIAK